MEPFATFGDIGAKPVSQWMNTFRRTHRARLVACVLRILTGGNHAEIRYAIVCAVAVYVIYEISGPMAVMHRPHHPVREVWSAFEGELEVSVRTKASGLHSISIRSGA